MFGRLPFHRSAWAREALNGIHWLGLLVVVGKVFGFGWSVGVPSLRTHGREVMLGITVMLTAGQRHSND